jgi:protein Tex
MNPAHIQRIASELKLLPPQVVATAQLLSEGGTVPFIARYRKEVTGSIDEVAITAIRDRLEQLAEFDKRREAILKSLQERDLLTPELQESIAGATTLTELEDIYLPFRPKRRTRATIAREKGLEPLAHLLWNNQDTLDPRAAAESYVDTEKGVASIEEALAGARDILAERVNEDQTARALMREHFLTKAVFETKVIAGKEEEGAKFKDYFECREPVTSAPSHRVLAMFRGENEGVLLLYVRPPEEEAVALLERLFVSPSGAAAALEVREAVRDSYKRLLSLSMESETRHELKRRADEEAIRVFAQNLRELLLAPPLGQKRVLALDPGFRTGCKLVVLDEQGKLIHNDTIYPHTGEGARKDAARRVQELCEKARIEAIAIGNGTASRETEAFVSSLGLPRSIAVVMVNESGASIYSASEAAREEFPEQDVTVRGSVSIGRRLMDPLAELVKIDPKSIGVGQYQHDVDQTALKRSLDDVVTSCVNNVGVEVNTASKQLLTYVAGLGPGLASNIVTHRNENGPFRSRHDLRKVSRLGPKAFEQCAGFLRIRGAEHPLDSSAVHPESYPLVDQMARDLGCTIGDLLADETLRRRIQLERYVTEKAGLPTLRDILAELAKPGRDPRQQFEAFQFAEGIEKLEDLLYRYPIYDIRR